MREHNRLIPKQQNDQNIGEDRNYLDQTCIKLEFFLTKKLENTTKNPEGDERRQKRIVILTLGLWMSYTYNSVLIYRPEI